MNADLERVMSEARAATRDLTRALDKELHAVQLVLPLDAEQTAHVHIFEGLRRHCLAFSALLNAHLNEKELHEPPRVAIAPGAKPDLSRFFLLGSDDDAA